MLLGPTLVKQCSDCRGYIEQRTIRSGNTFGATYWTDGKMEAPMLPDSPGLVKCPHCAVCSWISELEVVDEFEGALSSDAFTSAKPFLEPSFKDYISFLERSDLEVEAQRYVRIKAWWKSNDSRRKESDSGIRLSTEIENMESLIYLLDIKKDSDLLMAAEIKRELGFFSESLELLGAVMDEQLMQAANAIKELSLANVTSVCKLQFD